MTSPTPALSDNEAGPWPVVHGMLLFALLVLFAVALPALLWPWYLLLPLLGYAAGVVAIGPLRRSVPRLAIGTTGGWPLAFAVLVGVGAPAILVGFHLLIAPDVTDFAARLPVRWFGNVFLAGVCLSLVNAALEELIFRGILWDVVAKEWNPGMALVVTSLLFGIGHFDGYPPGILGAIMAGTYGITLGVLRWWTGGLALAYGCHVCADAAIISIVAASGTLEKL